MNNDIKKRVEKIVTENKNITFGVELLFDKLNEILAINEYKDKDLRELIRNSIDELSTDLRFHVVKDGRKSITYTNDSSRIKDKDFKESKISLFSWTILLSIISIYSIIDNTFITFSLTVFIAFLGIFFYFEDNNIEIGNSLSNKMTLAVPVFAFIYYMLTDPIFSKYSYLSLDDQLSTTNNLYYISISLLLSVFIILTVKNKVAFLLLVFIVITFPFVKMSLTLYGVLFIVLLFVFKKLKNPKYLDILCEHIDSYSFIHKNNSYYKTSVFFMIVTSLTTVTTFSDALKESYYKNLTVLNKGFCSNINDDVKIIKNNAKSDYVTIHSGDLIEQLSYFILNNQKDVSKLKPINDNIVIIDKWYEIIPNQRTYNSILEDLNRYKNVKDELNKKLSLKDDVYINKNSKLIKAYMLFKKSKNHEMSNLFSYKCD
jgi:hypothetical protein